MDPKAPKKGFWRVGQLARAAGVSTDTIRHYERKGALRAGRSDNGYREYPEESLERVKMVRQAMAIGFTLDELSAVFRVFDSGGVPCQHVRGLAANKLAEIEEHLREVIALRDKLRESLKGWDGRLASTAPGQRARLLMVLAAGDSDSHSSKTRTTSKPGFKKKG